MAKVTPPPEWTSGGSKRLDAAKFSMSSEHAARIPGVFPGASSQVVEAWELPDGWFGLIVSISAEGLHLEYGAEVRPNLDDLTESEVLVIGDEELASGVEQLFVHTVVGSCKLLSKPESWQRTGRCRRDIEHFARGAIANSETFMLELLFCLELPGSKLGMRLRYTDRDTVGEWYQEVSYRVHQDSLKWEASMPAFLPCPEVREALVALFVKAGECVGFELEHTLRLARRLDLESYGADHPVEGSSDPKFALSIVRAYSISATKVMFIAEVREENTEPYGVLAVAEANGPQPDSVSLQLPMIPRDAIPQKLPQVLASVALDNAEVFFFDGASLGYTRRTEFEGTAGVYEEVMWDEQLELSSRPVRAEILELWQDSEAATLMMLRLERAEVVIGEMLLRLEQHGKGLSATHKVHLPGCLRVGGSEHKALEAAFARFRRVTFRESDSRVRRERPEFNGITVTLPAEAGRDDVVTVRTMHAVAFGGQELDVEIEVRVGDNSVRRELVTYYGFKYLPAGDSPCMVKTHTVEMQESELTAVRALGLQISDTLRESGDWSW